MASICTATAIDEIKLAVNDLNDPKYDQNHAERTKTTCIRYNYKLYFNIWVII